MDKCVWVQKGGKKFKGKIPNDLEDHEKEIVKNIAKAYFYITGCGETFYPPATLTINDLQDCPYCGKKIEVKNEN